VSRVASPFRPSPRKRLLERALPLSARLPGYRAPEAGRDLLAGLTVAALALPSGMAFAEVAGLSPVQGLYALLLPSVAYALLGSSRQVIVGPEGSLAALLAAAVLPLAAAGSPEAASMAATLALMVGALFLLARVARLSWIADYLSRPVLVGYIHGVAGVLIVGQLGKLLGLDIEALDPVPQLIEVGREIGEASLTTIAVSVAAMAVLFSLRAWAPRFPAALVVVVAGIAVSASLDLQSHGLATVGEVPAGLPAISAPTTSFSDAAQLLPAAIGLFLVALADGILTARAFAGRRGEEVDASQEMAALGIANAAGGISQGMPIGVSGSRTAVNDTMGASSQLAGLMAAGAIALIVLFLTGPIAELPKAVLGAVIVYAAVGLVDPSAWRALKQSDNVELAIAAVTTALVLVTGVLTAIAFAVGLSIVDVVRRGARPHDAVLGWAPDLGRYADVSVHRQAQVVPGVVIYRLDDRLFFANASYVEGRVREAIRGAEGETHALVFDAEALAYVDTTGLEALLDLFHALDREGIAMVMARMKAEVEQQLQEAAGEEFPPERCYPTVRAAAEGERVR
jgi:sulfate permease, SulP family